jgi:hypothetical protein
MVPYFSWQRSHAVHHSKTNHLTEGETHVPYTMESGKKTLAKRENMRKGSFNLPRTEASYHTASLRPMRLHSIRRQWHDFQFFCEIRIHTCELVIFAVKVTAP